MHVLEVQLNGETLALVGASDALMFAAHLNTSIEEAGATLGLQGMRDLGGNRTSHVNWLPFLELSHGDLVSFYFFESKTATAPIEDIATDSEEHIAEQAEFEEELKSNPPTTRLIEAIQPDATLQLRMPGSELITATLEGGREFIAFRILWNQWRPEHCHMLLSSFSQQEALVRSGRKAWFQGTLGVGERCVVKVGA